MPDRCTNHHGMEEELHQRVDELKAVQLTLLDIIKPHDLNALLHTIVERAAKLLKAKSGRLYLCNPELREVECVISFNTKADYRGTVLKYGEGAAGGVAQNGKAIIIDDYRSWCGRASIFEEDQPFTAVVSAPLIWQGKVTGVIHVLDDAEKRRFSENDLDILAMFANHAAIAVENTRLYEETQRENKKRVRQEETLRESEEKYRALLEITPDVIMRFDGDGRHTYVSPSIRNVAGMEPEEFLGKRHRDLGLPKEHVDFWEDKIETVFASGEPVSDVFEIELQNRKTIFDWRLIPEFGPAGEVKSVYSTARDITELKLSEERLRLSEEHFRFAVSQLPGTLWTTDEQLLFTLSEGAGLGDIGLSTGQVIGMSLYDFFQTNEEILPIEMHRRALLGESVSYEYTHEESIFEAFLEPYRDADGTIVGVLGIAFNVTEKRRAEKALQVNEARLRAIFDSSPDAITTTDLNGIITSCNQATLKLHGFSSKKEIIGINSVELIAPQDREMVPTNFKKTLDLGSVRDIEYTLLTRDGEQFPGELSASVIRDSEGNPVAFVGITKDIRDRKKAEETLQLRNIAIASSVEGIAFADFDSKLSYVNSSFLEMWGYDEDDQIVGRSVLEFWEDKDAAEQVIDALDREGFWKGELIARHKNGSSFEVNVKASTAKDEKNNPLCIMATFEDITEQKRAAEDQKQLEVQLRQSQKMETIGQLAGGIAHDFNNLLTVITGTSELALMNLSPGDSFYDEFVEVRRTAERAADLSNQLLAFSRRQIVEPRIFNMNRVLMDLERLFRRLIGEHIELVFSPFDDLWLVKTDPGQFEQILTNLIVNARDAMPNGGRLTVETANVTFDSESVRTRIGTEPGDYVMLAVRDTGVGMGEETRSRIFEPFFTTKRKGEGTGLGLSTCYGIVKQNRGNIWVYSEPGRGTTFKVYLPRTQESSSKAQEQAPVSPGGTETVLVVEDEPSVRKMIKHILTLKGYSVLEAAHGEEAQRLATRYRGTIHLLLTDVIMPRMGGKELAEPLTELYPDLKVLYMSGYTDNAIVNRGVLEPGLAFLQKPFTPAGLLSKIRETLE